MMASASEEAPLFYCHTCDQRINPVTEEVICPNCRGGFVEKLEETQDSRSSTDSTTPSQQRNSAFPLNLLFPVDNSSHSSRNVFTFNLANDNARSPRQDGNSASPSSSNASAPYSLRQRPDRARRTGFGAPQPYQNQDVIHHVIQSVFGGFDPSIFQLSFGGGLGGMQSLNVRGIHGNTADYAWGPNGLDNIISQLLGQLENAGPPPASKKTIDALPTISISQEDVDHGRDCSVCMNAFELEENVKKLPCAHFFHIPCIDPWLELHNTCPICRKVVEEDDPSSCGPQSVSNSSNNNSTGPARGPDSSSSQPSSSVGQTNSSSFFSLFPNLFSSERQDEDDQSNNHS